MRIPIPPLTLMVSRDSEAALNLKQSAYSSHTIGQSNFSESGGEPDYALLSALSTQCFTHYRGSGAACQTRTDTPFGKAF